MAKNVYSQQKSLQSPARPVQVWQSLASSISVIQSKYWNNLNWVKIYPELCKIS